MIKNAKWITSPVDTKEAADTFVKEFSLLCGKTVKKATLSLSSMGVYAPYLNGKRVDNSVLMPGWTSYKSRVQYQVYDVSGEVKENNKISVGVGQGWAVGKIGFGKERYFYTDKKALIALLKIVYTDGTVQNIGSDESWRVFSGEVTYSEIYHGETVDKTRDMCLIGNAVFTKVSAKLVPTEGEFIREHERIAPVSLIIAPNGDRIIDFGQNMTGYVEVRIKAQRGARVKLHHAEVLDREGNFYTDNYRSARNENLYITSGGDDVFKPTYTFQGFRYVRLAEYPYKEVDLNNFTAIVVHSEMKRTGKYHTGNEKINQLYHNVIWGQKSNYLDVPTDCPQRDERLGWTGDAQVFCRTAAINYDVERFFEKWLSDLAIEQAEAGGAVDGICPITHISGTRTSAAWGDVACIAPWQIYLAYGNKKLLKKHFPMMRAWVDYLISAGPEKYLWLTGFHFGDWLGMDAGEDSFMGATSHDLIATAFFAHSTDLLVKAGEELLEDVEYYKDVYKNVRRAFREYFMENGMPKESFSNTTICPPNKNVYNIECKGVTQTALVLILHFGLADESERPALAKKLVDLINENDGKMTTGFVGTPYILHALSENGYTDVAYSLLFEERNPSWLYSVNRGATTMWEHWNGIKEDGSFWLGHMNSFNHYAYGSVFDWMFGVSSGIKPLSAGYKEIALSPHPCKELGYADASIESRSGYIRSYWYYKGDAVYYEFEIPEGTTAHLTLPSGRSERLSAGKYLFVE